MNEVIARVMEAEAEAKRIVEAARIEADRILAEARVQAGELSTRIRRETQAEADRLIEDTVQAASQEKQARLKRYTAKLESSLPLDGPEKEEAVNAALKCVCYPEKS